MTKRTAEVDSAEDGSAPKKLIMTQLDLLKTMSIVVADTGDFQQLEKYQPQDSTTNPSLIYAAANMKEYEQLLKDAVAEAKEEAKEDDESALIGDIVDRLVVKFGCEILKIVPGVVSTEVDASLSFDVSAMVAKAHKFVSLYKKEGVDAKKRVLIKLSTTWEGIEACRQLEKEGIHCNMTLLFSFPQAVACAEAHATLISPFVGRILDWHKANDSTADYAGDKDPGVISVTEIYNYYKAHDYKTIVMAASFRSIDEIIHLAGCDKVTIAPKLLQELADDKKSDKNFTQQLTAESAPSANQHKTKISLTEQQFRWELNENTMATQKLAEGIQNFNKDHKKLCDFIKKQL